jgi:flagellar biosynthesis protein FlhG
LGNIIRLLKPQFSWTVVDCRGGIDQESLAVCAACDDILLVGETDTTSYQASLHVIDVLNKLGLAGKLRGFILNKVFEDPSVVARTAQGNFGTRHLVSVPLDITATRRFLVGRLPDRHSSFSIHVRAGLSKAYPDAHIISGGTVWEPSDYDGIKLSTVESVRGGTILLGFSLLLAFFWIQQLLTHTDSVVNDRYYLVCAWFLSVCSGMESVRRMLGRGLESYIRFFSKLLSRNRIG